MANLSIRPPQGTCVVTDPRPPLLGIPAARLPSFLGCNTCSTIESAGLGLYFRQALLLDAGPVTGVTGAWGGPAVCVVGGTGHSVLEEAEPCSPGKGAARRQNKSPCCHWPPPTPSLEGAQGVVS